MVFDVLRATSSILTALAHGAEAIRPVLSVEEARAQRERWPGAWLGGERGGDRIEGFDLGNSPLEYCRPGLRRILTTTTNGTVALRACAEAGAGEVLVGALLNLSALAASLRERPPQHLLLVCAGTGRDLALEDVLAAGMLAAAFPEAEWTDAARTAVAVYKQHAADLPGALRHSANGRVLMEHGRADDVAWCARVSAFETLAAMRDGEITVGRPGLCPG